MKKQFFKKSMALLLVTLMTFSAGACDTTSTTPQPDENPKNGARPIVNVEKVLYASLENSNPISVAHYENQPEILLIEINSAVQELLNESLFEESDVANVSVSETSSKATLRRENGAYCELDFVKDTIYFSDYDYFTMGIMRNNPHDILCSTYLNEEEESVFFKRVSFLYTPGNSMEVNLAERNIPLDIYNGKKYIPLQTFNDVFLSPFGINIAYNGEDLFLIMGDQLAPDLEEKYYLDQRTERSQALAEFNYNELCLYLDLTYGLQEEHGISYGFDSYLQRLGLKEQLLGLDSINTYSALGSLTLGYFADGHCVVKQASPYLGVASPQPDMGMDMKISPEIIAMSQNDQIFKTARAEQMEEVAFYEKCGNTAYVTFDAFTLEDRSEGYDGEPMDLEDTLSIIMRAHREIVNDEEIENVVLDLSCNGGGAADAAVYVVAWMLGYCDFSVCNSITQSLSTTRYAVDVNLDGQFDENDTIADKNLYCLVSSVSFSCGNLVPAILQASGMVSIVGKTSGGGACVVRSGVTADGTRFCVSGPQRISTVKDGSYYSVDKGVTPDIYLSKIESFYDRDELAEFLNSLR